MINNKTSFVATDQYITIYFNGETTHIFSKDQHYAQALLALASQDQFSIEKILTLLNKPQGNHNLSFKDFDFSFKEHGFIIRGGKFLIEDICNIRATHWEVPYTLGEEIKRLTNAGLPYRHLLNFADQLMDNPDSQIVNGLFDLIKEKHYSITKDGSLIGHISSDRNLIEDNNFYIRRNTIHLNPNRAKETIILPKLTNALIKKNIFEVEFSPANVVHIREHYLICNDYNINKKISINNKDNSGSLDPNNWDDESEDSFGFGINESW